jgi:hypothetical protein
VHRPFAVAEQLTSIKLYHGTSRARPRSRHPRASGLKSVMEAARFAPPLVGLFRSRLALRNVPLVHSLIRCPTEPLDVIRTQDIIGSCWQLYQIRFGRIWSSKVRHFRHTRWRLGFAASVWVSVVVKTWASEGSLYSRSVQEVIYVTSQ